MAEVHAYDPGDKRLAVRVGGAAVKTYGYRSEAEIPSRRRMNEVYRDDPCGRTTSVTSASGTTQLSYDHEDRLVQVWGGEGR